MALVDRLLRLNQQQWRELQALWDSRRLLLGRTQILNIRSRMEPEYKISIRVEFIEKNDEFFFTFLKLILHNLNQQKSSNDMYHLEYL